MAFRALGYVRGGRPYGVIGGNVCLVDVKRGALVLSFLHGAFLPDPQRLLVGRGKSKRDCPIRGVEDLGRAALEDLVRAAIAYDPGAPVPPGAGSA